MSDLRDKLRDHVSDQIVAAQIDARIALHKGEHENAGTALFAAAIAAAQEQVTEVIYSQGYVLARVADLQDLRHQLRALIGADDDEAQVLNAAEGYLVELIERAKGFHE